jgi:hypothetical protein
MRQSKEITSCRSSMRGAVHGITSESEMMNVRHAMSAVPGEIDMAVSSVTGAVRVMDAAHGRRSGAGGIGSGRRSAGEMDRATSGGRSRAGGIGSGRRSAGEMDRATSGGRSRAGGIGSGRRSRVGIVENDAMIATRGGGRAMIVLHHALLRKKSNCDASR